MKKKIKEKGKRRKIDLSISVSHSLIFIAKPHKIVHFHIENIKQNLENEFLNQKFEMESNKIDKKAFSTE